MTFPVFASGDVLNASDMNAVGLWRVATGTATTASTLSVNSCFTSDYENYLVTWNGLSSGNDVGFNFRFRASGTDATTDYRRVASQMYPGIGNPAVGGSNTATEISLGTISSTNRSASSYFVMAPQVAQRSIVHGQMTHVQSGGTIDAYTIHGFLNNTTSYDGFTIYPASGTITGTVCVYGIRNA